MCVDMFHRPDPLRKSEIETGISEDPIWKMREPPGALGDIVRRMKRHAALQQSIGLAPDVKRGAA